MLDCKDRRLKKVNHPLVSGVVATVAADLYVEDPWVHFSFALLESSIVWFL